MALVDVRGFNTKIMPESGSFTQGLKDIQNANILGNQFAQQDRSAQIRQLLGQAGQQQPQTQQQAQLAAQTKGLGGEQALSEQPQAIIPEAELIAQAKKVDPVIADKMMKDAGIDNQTKLEEASRFASQLIYAPKENREKMIIARAESLQSQGRDNKDTLQLLEMTPEEQNNALMGFQLAALNTKDRLTVEGIAKKGSSIGAGQREFESLISGFSEKDKEKARKIKAGLDSRAIGSAVQTIANKGTVEEVSAVTSTIAADKEAATGDVKGIQNQINKLNESKVGREQSIKKANKFIKLFKSRNASSGAGRKALSYLPGVYSDQGRLDEEFNAFAEVAARQTLKANGETKPTDADVDGMKKAMFGIGRDESVNLILLDDYLDQQEADSLRLKNLKSGRRLVNRRNSVVVDEFISKIKRKKAEQTKQDSPQGGVKFLGFE